MKLRREKWGLNAEVVAEMRFDIPNMYKFHKQKSVDVEVDLIRIFWEEDEGNCEEVDGEDGPQQEILNLCMMLYPNQILMTELRIRTVDQIMKHWNLGKYATVN